MNADVVLFIVYNSTYLIDERRTTYIGYIQLLLNDMV